MVYIVDDDPAIQQALERLMRSAGLRAETFASVLDLLDKGFFDERVCIVADIRLLLQRDPAFSATHSSLIHRDERRSAPDPDRAPPSTSLRHGISSSAPMIAAGLRCRWQLVAL
jgi:hypothetical protein